jgi:hypothetical protein
MAKGDGKQFKSKPAGKQAIKAGPSGGMHNFEPVGNQAAGGTGVKMSGGSKSFKPPSAGGSGKMQKFSPVKPQKAGITSKA